MNKNLDISDVKKSHYTKIDTYEKEDFLWFKPKE